MLALGCGDDKENAGGDSWCGSNGKWAMEFGEGTDKAVPLGLDAKCVPTPDWSEYRFGTGASGTPVLSCPAEWECQINALSDCNLQWTATSHRIDSTGDITESWEGNVHMNTETNMTGTSRHKRTIAVGLQSTSIDCTGPLTGSYIGP